MLQNSKLKFANKQIYGQLVIGPPGSGKTTYCAKAFEFYKELGRDVCIVNLDPANENMDYAPIVDVKHLITVEDAMNHMHLGPNGALIHCIEYLESHFDDWFLPELRKVLPKCNYLIFDCPGQVELYTHYEAMSNIFHRLESEGFHLVTLNLVDSHYCSEPTKFVSTVLLALNMMLRMSLPHVNILSKADQIQKHESLLKFNLDFYTDVLDLSYLLEALDDSPHLAEYHKLNASICSMIEDFGLVTFQLLDARNTESMLRLRNHVDKANGYIYQAGEEHAVNALLACAVGAEPETIRHAKDIDPYLNLNNLK